MLGFLSGSSIGESKSIVGYTVTYGQHHNRVNTIISGRDPPFSYYYELTLHHLVGDLFDYVDCSSEMWIDYWKFLTKRMHDGFSSRSTVHVGRSLFVRMSFPTFVSWVGNLTAVFSCLSVHSRCGLQQHYNIPVFYTRLTCVNAQPAQPKPSTAPPLPCETHSAQRLASTLVGGKSIVSGA